MIVRSISPGLAFVAILSGVTFACLFAGDKSPSSNTTKAHTSHEQACELGTQILRIQQLLERRDHSPAAMKTITDLGHDTRYYVFTRGWLREVLLGLESQQSVTQNPERSQQLADQIQFLKKAIRHIDLE